MKQTATKFCTCLSVAALLTILSFTSSAQIAAPIILGANTIQVDANVNNSRVNLAWKAQQEKNINHFEVERSFNAEDFKTAGLVLDGFETETSQKSYQFRDNSKELNGQKLAYYRLKQIGVDESVSYSAVVTVKM